VEFSVKLPKLQVLRVLQFVWKEQCYAVNCTGRVCVSVSSSLIVNKVRQDCFKT
jgi:hypothetical protein